MSGPIDEAFTDQNLKSGTVFEFGVSPGHHTTRRAARPDLDITGIDLYLPESVEGYKFIHGDLIDQPTDSQFDNVACVSSWEHCGIETVDYQSGSVPNFDKHLLVAQKLKSLVKPGGQLLITCPFGPEEVYLCDNEGHSFRPDEAGGYIPKWGYRTLSLMYLKAVFHPLLYRKAEAFELVGEDYFNLKNWTRIDPYRDHVKFGNRVERKAVIGAVFDNL